MDSDEFEKLLYKKGFTRPTCPTCGSVKWHGMKDVILLPTETEGAVVNRGVRSISAICNKCGFMFLYDANTLMED